MELKAGHTHLDPSPTESELPRPGGSAAADAADSGNTRHGTTTGWARHKSLGERPCDPCYQAKAEYDARRRAAPSERNASRERTRAQSAALVRLRAMYPTVYAALYAEEKRKRGIS